jgi:dTMP kinase
MRATTSRPVFVVFEGLDGAGKSTCAKQLATTLGAVLLTTPSPAIREFRDQLIDSFQSCQEAAQLFYLATVFAASDQAKSLLALGQSVVMDRYFLSTQAYAQFRGSKIGLDELQSQLLPADLTVYLDAPLATRKQRLIKRNCTPADCETLSDEADARLRKLHAERARLAIAGKWLRIDSTTASPADIAALVQRAIGDLTGT